MRKNSSYPVPETPQTFARILESRRAFVSGQLNEVCQETEKPRILSVANGALREAEAALDLCRTNGGIFVVVDGGAEPPDLFRPDQGTRVARHIWYPYGAIPSRENIGEFDYVYVLNLFSELNQERARAAAASLISLVRPGGRMLISNFTAEFAEAAWCESHGRWGAYYRCEEEMADLVPDSRVHGISGHAVWRDESDAILYLEIQKAANARRRGGRVSSSSSRRQGEPAAQKRRPACRSNRYKT